MKPDCLGGIDVVIVVVMAGTLTADEIISE
jgi:hypothetical protein